MHTMLPEACFKQLHYYPEMRQLGQLASVALLNTVMNTLKSLRPCFVVRNIWQYTSLPVHGQYCASVCTIHTLCYMVNTVPVCAPYTLCYMDNTVPVCGAYTLCYMSLCAVQVAVLLHTGGLVYQSQGGLKIFCSVYTSTPFPLTSAPPSAPPFLSCLYIHCMADIHLHTYIPFPFPAIYTHMYKWEDIKRQEVCSLWFS